MKYNAYITRSRNQRAEQSSSLLPATSQHGHSWHRAPVGPMAIYLFSVKTFFFFFRCSFFDKKGGVGFFYNWCSLTTPYSTRGHISRNQLLLCPFITPRHGPHRRHSLYCWRCVFTAPLLSNRRPTVPRVCFCGNVFSESLPSNEYTRHNIFW
jgi:hypothetical protein